MFEGLDSIPWAQLRHAYGQASDVPDLLRRCAGLDREIADTAIYRLDMSLFHQGGAICSAARAALPFMVNLAAGHTPVRAEALRLITDLAEEATTVQPRSVDPSWRDALSAATPDLLALLDDADAMTRRAVSRLAAVGGLDQDAALAAVAQRSRVENDGTTGLDLVLALAPSPRAAVIAQRRSLAGYATWPAAPSLSFAWQLSSPWRAPILTCPGPGPGPMFWWTRCAIPRSRYGRTAPGSAVA
jgi:hypothetical protein